MVIGSLENIFEIFERARAEHEPVIFPTDTIYGIGAPISDKIANEKIFNIKSREKNKPFPVLVSSFEQAHELAYISAQQLIILDKLWAGRYTFILRAREDVNSLYVHNGKIALRMPDVMWLRELIEKTGALSATSANLSGKDYINDIEMIINSFSANVKYFIKLRTNDNNSSTIIDLTTDEPTLIRGEINLHEILSQH